MRAQELAHLAAVGEEGRRWVGGRVGHGTALGQGHSAASRAAGAGVRAREELALEELAHLAGERLAFVGFAQQVPDVGGETERHRGAPEGDRPEQKRYGAIGAQLPS